MKVTKEQREKLTFYLKEFYKRFPDEKFTIFHYVKYVKQRLKNNKDCWNAVCGDTGSGKSLFVIMAQILFGRPYSLIKNISYIPMGDEIQEKLNNMAFQSLLIDESARDLRAINWQSKSQQKVTLTAQTERFKNNWVFLNMPNFNEFTKSLRINSIKFRAIVVYRNNLYARIIIQSKSRNWRSEDAWNDDHINSIYERLEKKRREITNDDILKIERSSTSYVMDFIIPNLEIILPEVTAEYDRLKLESRNNNNDIEKIDKINKFEIKYKELLAKVSKAMYYNKLNIGKIKISQKELSDFLGISTQTFKKYLAMEENKPLSETRKEITAE